MYPNGDLIESVNPGGSVSGQMPGSRRCGRLNLPVVLVGGTCVCPPLKASWQTHKEPNEFFPSFFCVCGCVCVCVCVCGWVRALCCCFFTVHFLSSLDHYEKPLHLCLIAL